MAIVMVGVSSFGQTNEEIEKVYNENRPIFAKLMSDYVTKLKPSYENGMKYETFLAKVAVPKELSKDGAIILNKVYNYLETSANEKFILKNETGLEVAMAYVNFSKIKSDKTFENYLFGNSSSQAKGFWGTLWGGIKAVVSWVWDHATEIISTYTACCNAHLCCK